MNDKTIKVDYLARVEGEGSIYVKIKNNEVADVKFRVFEPPRFFEAFLRGRSYSEAPDITARICGICPVAYQMSSVHAMENAFGVTVSRTVRDLRRLLYCGEWIESHVLHVYMLHAPDFLGCQDVIEVAKKHPEVVRTALAMKKIGNDIVALLGGREIHPINVRVGGFYRIPAKKELSLLVEKLKWLHDAAVEMVKWSASLPFPEIERDYEFVALSHPDEYPMNEGRLVSNKGLDINVKEYEFYFQEEHLSYANALQSVLKERGPYLVGPLARFNLNFERLTPSIKELAHEVNVLPMVRNPFKGIVARSIETLYACDEALRIIEEYEPADVADDKIEPKPGLGFGCTEAPRGILYHRYRISEEGTITDARIIPPTSQNQRSMEDDLRAVVSKNISMEKEELTWLCEQSVRNYDPCISCATHFVRLEMEEPE
ncbi:MAG TPA: Ni/Fe hydrogenase subunit alpha [Bacteroidota bacterium]|nr:Ni/Fe hydrogenase subunit alpha [Bacteroidota bacterium]